MKQDITRRDFVSKTLSASAAVSTLAAASAHAEEKPKPAPAAGPQTIKKSIKIEMLPGKTPEDKFKVAVDNGFVGIETNAVDNPKEVEARTAASKKVGIPIHCVVCMTHWSHPLSSNDPKVVAEGLRGLRLALDNAKHHGASAILLVPAVVRPGVATYQQAYSRSQARISEVVPIAKEMGIVIGVENVWNNFLLSPIEFARYVDEFDTPFVQAYFDIGNVIRFGYPQDWIRTLGPRICRMHVKAAAFSKGRYGFPANLGQGNVPWPEVRKAIADIKYAGYITYEMGGGNPDRIKSLSKQFDQKLLGKS